MRLERYVHIYVCIFYVIVNFPGLSSTSLPFCSFFHLQARPPADAFVGYGGVTVRENVAKGADWFVYNFQVRGCWARRQ